MTVVYGTGTIAMELVTLDGPPPAVQVTLTGITSLTTFTLTRLCAGDTETVPGWRAKPITDSDVSTDPAAPLNLPITYTLSTAGGIVASATITLPSTTAWLQDPLQPDKSIPVVLTGNVPGAMTLDGTALKQIDYKNQASEIQILGSALPVFFGGQRRARTGINITMKSYTDDVSATFLNIVQEAPILLLRPITKMIGLPPLAYLNADVSQKPFTTHLPGLHQQIWTITGDLVAAVLQAAISGYVTNDEVQQLLAGYTNDQIQAKAAGTTNLDWQKNPLIFSTL